MCHMPFLFVLVTIILTFVWLQHISLLLSSVFCLLFSYFILWSSKPFDFWSSIFCSPFILWFLIYLLPYSMFHLMFLCSVSIIIFPPSVHYSLPSLPDLDNLTFYPLWLCESSFLHSSYYTILRITPSHVVQSSFWFCTYSPACNCCLPLQKHNPPLSPLLV